MVQSVSLPLCACVVVPVFVFVFFEVNPYGARLSCLFVSVMCAFVYKRVFKVPLGRGSPLGSAYHLLCHSYCGQY